MEKVIYLLWRDPATGAAAFAAKVRGALAPQLKAAGALGLQVNLADADVAPAVALKQVVLKPQPEAFVQLWMHSAVARFRKPFDDLIAGAAPRHAAYLVTESRPTPNVKHSPKPGERTHGFSQIALLRRPPKLAYAAWLDVWHNSHTDIAIVTQSTFEYIQNVVVRPLSADAPAIDAIVEETFPPAAMTDYKTYFNSPGDDAGFKKNLNTMLQSVNRFIEHGTIDVIPTSQYVC